MLYVCRELRQMIFFQKTARLHVYRCGLVKKFECSVSNFPPRSTHLSCSDTICINVEHFGHGTDSK